jgi:hypothetical protein
MIGVNTLSSGVRVQGRCALRLAMSCVSAVWLLREGGNPWLTIAQFARLLVSNPKFKVQAKFPELHWSKAFSSDTSKVSHETDVDLHSNSAVKRYPAVPLQREVWRWYDCRWTTDSRQVSIHSTVSNSIGLFTRCQWLLDFQSNEPLNKAP